MGKKLRMSALAKKSGGLSTRHTLRLVVRFERDGLVRPVYTPGGQRRVDEDEFAAALAKFRRST